MEVVRVVKRGRPPTSPEGKWGRSHVLTPLSLSPSPSA
jgi:hypothetical protein